MTSLTGSRKFALKCWIIEAFSFEVDKMNAETVVRISESTTFKKVVSMGMHGLQVYSQAELAKLYPILTI